MNDETRIEQADNGDDTLSSLLKLAGPSATIDRDVEERVYASVRQAWDEGQPKYRSLRWGAPLGHAAGVLIAIGMTLSMRDEAPPAPHAVGTVAVVMPGAAAGGYSVGGEIFPGDVLDTSELNGMSVELEEDVSLRIDTHTVLRIDDADEFTLIAGRIYLDSGDRIYPDSQLTVHTAVGTATDVGTQFAVRYQDAEMNVAVRDGQVDLSDGSQVHRAVRGDQLTMRAGSEVELDSVHPSGDEWNWAVELAPAFDIEDKSLLDFLKWVSKETGLELRIDNQELRMETMQPRLHGMISGMTPLQALDAVMSTTNFEYVVDDNAITITR